MILKDGTKVQLGCEVTTNHIANETLTPGSSSRGQVVEISEDGLICVQYGVYNDEAWVSWESCSNASEERYPIVIRAKDSFF